MAALGQHIRIRWADDRVIAPRERERRVVARGLLKVAREVPLLCFGLADTHLHAESLGDERLANEIGRRIGISLHLGLGLPVSFHVLPPRPIMDLWHLLRCFRYIHTQAAHHKVSWERWFEATSLPDLLGMRPRGAFLAARMQEQLPRLQRSELLSWIGLSQPGLALDSPGPASSAEVLDAAHSAAALDSLGGRTSEGISLRRAVMEVLGDGISRGELACILGLSVRTVTRLRSIPPDLAMVRAIRLNLGLRQELGRQAADIEARAQGRVQAQAREQAQTQTQAQAKAQTQSRAQTQAQALVQAQSQALVQAQNQASAVSGSLAQAHAQVQTLSQGGEGDLVISSSIP
ncbi:MAG: hypothetical protein RBU30_21750 [Polyangia bacterium]|jgi:hypothetical protein|nr:hypothetical protein [Polyangia bacterium]